MLSCCLAVLDSSVVWEGWWGLPFVACCFSSWWCFEILYCHCCLVVIFSVGSCCSSLLLGVTNLAALFFLFWTIISLTYQKTWKWHFQISMEINEVGVIEDHGTINTNTNSIRRKTPLQIKTLESLYSGEVFSCSKLNLFPLYQWILPRLILALGKY